MGSPFPTFDDFKPTGRIHDPKQLAFWSVESNGFRDLKFTAIYQGEHVATVFGTCWVGKTMDEVLPGFAKNIGLAAAVECATYGALFTPSSPRLMMSVSG